MLTANDLLLSVGCKFTFAFKQNKVSGGGGIGGFGDSVIASNCPVFGFRDGGALTLRHCSPALANGTFVQYADKMVTMGATSTQGFLVSDRFGGCDFTILRYKGLIVGAHVAVESEESNQRASIAEPPKDWSTVGTWSSKPYIGRWGSGPLLAFAFFEGNCVKLVALGLGGYPPTITHAELAHTFAL